jgi:hypothetical protein
LKFKKCLLALLPQDTDSRSTSAKCKHIQNTLLFLPVSDVDHGGSKLLWLERFPQFLQLNIKGHCRGNPCLQSFGGHDDEEFGCIKQAKANGIMQKQNQKMAVFINTMISRNT